VGCSSDGGSLVWLCDREGSETHAPTDAMIASLAIHQEKELVSLLLRVML
jgi:hypothetical protein